MDDEPIDEGGSEMLELVGLHSELQEAARKAAGNESRRLQRMPEIDMGVTKLQSLLRGHVAREKLRESRLRSQTNVAQHQASQRREHERRLPNSITKGDRR